MKRSAIVWREAVGVVTILVLSSALTESWRWVHIVVFIVL